MYSWTAVAAASSYTVAIRSDGSLWTWGLGTNGQLGTNGTISRSSPVQLGSDSYIAVTAYDSIALAIRNDFRLFGWGQNNLGQLGDGTTIARSNPVQIFTPYWQSIGGGISHNVALKSDGTLWAWGLNSDGQLGDGTTISRSSPVQVSIGQSPFPIALASAPWSFISRTSTNSTYALQSGSNANAYAWGSNIDGQLGDGTTISRSFPVQITTFSGPAVNQITAGFALLTGGTLWVWGRNTSGQLGDSTTVSRSVPIQLGATTYLNVPFMYSGTNGHSAFIDAIFRLFTTGLNTQGQLGDNTTISRSSPVQVFASLDINQIVAKDIGTTIFLTKNGNAFTTGIGTNGQRGDNTTFQRSAPTQISGNYSWSSIANGRFNMRAVRSDGTLWTWGNNSNGDLGLNDLTGRSSPVQVGEQTWWSEVFPGTNGMALTNDNRLFVWGDNTDGQLGDNTTVNKSSPVQVPGSWIFACNSDNGPLSGNPKHSIAIRSDRTVWTWGSSASGQLGQNNTISRSSPVQILSGVTNQIIQVSAGLQHSLILDSSGTLYSVGLNSAGQLGLNDIASRSSPVQVGAVGGFRSTFNAIAAGSISSYAIGNTGLLFSWGDNNFGRLGDNTTINRSSPTQIGSNNNWIAVFPNVANGLAQNSLGNIFAWGSNQFGELGENTTISRSSPVQLRAQDTTALFVQVVSIGPNAYGAVTNDYRVFTWGVNDSRILGTGEATTVTRSNPVQILSNVLISYIGGIGVNSANSSAYAISIDGTFYGWGTNTSNVFNNPNATISIPTVIGINLSNNKPYNITNSFMNSGGLSFTDQQNIMYTWGSNANGNLGDNTTVAKSSPTILSGGASNSFTSVSAGAQFTVATTSDGKLLTWGTNNIGQVQPGTTISRLSPVFVNSQGSFVSVTADKTGDFAFAIDNNSKLYGWGNNSGGQLGNISQTSTSIRFGDSSFPAYIIDIGNNTGLLYVWGFNTQGQLGQNDVTARSSPVIVPGNWTFINGFIANPTAAVTNAVFAIRQDGTLYGWGINTQGQLGNNSTQARSSPVQIGLGRSWAFVASGEVGTYAIDSSGFLYSWGGNSNGQLGDNLTVNRSSPVQIGVSTWSYVAAGTSHVIAIRSDKTLWAWGLNNQGQLGDNTTINRSSPVQVAGSWNNVAAGYFGNMYGIDINNKLYAWGYNANGALGDGTTINRSIPVLIQSLSTSNFTQVATGGFAMYALTADNKIFTVGSNNSGALGQFDVIDRSMPVQIGSNILWKSIRGNAQGCMALDVNDRIFVWGIGANGLSGLGDTFSRSSPVQLNSGYVNFVPFPTQIGNSSWSQVAAGGSFAVGRTSDNRLFGWGTNLNRQVGSQSIRSLTGGIQGMGFLRNDGILFATGSNSFGQQAWGLNSQSTNQLNIGYVGQNSSLRFTTGSYKRNNSFYITTQGKLFAAGQNTSGELGDGTTINRSQPTQIGNSSWSVVDTSSFGSVTLAIKNDGTLWAWGSNQYGQFGSSVYGQNVLVSSPVQIGVSSWTNISVGDQFVLALKADNTLFGWGRNDFGQLGQNFTNTNTTFSWFSITTNGSSTYAIRSDRKLFAWGLNTSGQLGDGTTISRSLPAQITTSSYSVVSAGVSHVMALTVTGNIFTWGGNSAGQLGDNLTVNRSSPVQIGNFSVTSPYTFIATVWNFGYSIWRRGNNTYGFGNSLPALGYFLGFNDTVARITPDLISNNYSAMALTNSGTVAISSGVIISTGLFPGNGLSFTSSPVQVAAVTPATSWTTLMEAYVGTGGTNVLFAAIDNLGKLFVWGQNNTGTFGSGIQNETFFTPREYKPGTSFVQVATGSKNSPVMAAITNTGALWLSGFNGNGDIGDGTTISRSSPVQVAGTWSAIKIREDGWYAVDSLGRLFGTGLGTTGQLGQNDTVSRSSPVQIATGTSFSQVYPGTSHVVAKTTIGTIFAWGSNQFGQLGDGTAINRSSPVQIGTSSWTMLAASAGGTSGILNGDVYGWGIMDYVAPVPLVFISRRAASTTITNQLPVLSPVQLTSYNTVTFSWSQISAGHTHSTAISSDGKLWTWGANSSGQLGLQYAAGNEATYVPSPVQVNGGGSWSTVSAGLDHTLAIKTDGKLFGWGGNFNNQLTTTNNLIKWTAAGQFGGIRSDGTLWMWYGGGANTGAVGDGFATSQRSLPVQIGLDTNWSDLSVTVSYSYAIKTDGTIYAWGANTLGELGDNTTISRSSPVQVAGTTGLSFTFVTTDGGAQLALTNDKRLFVWGQSSFIQGLNQALRNLSSPVQIAGSWNSVVASNGNVLAIRSDSTLWAWGLNNFGALGDGTTISRSSPTQIGSSSWTFVANGRNTAAAITLDNRLFTWGEDTNGVLGSNTANIHRSSPVQVGASSWTQVFAVQQGFGASAAPTFYGFQFDVNKRMTNLFAWGFNTFGAVGDNTTASRSSPVQISANLRTGVQASAPFGSGVQGPPISFTSFVKGSQAGNPMAIDNDGIFWRWGLSNLLGANLGDNSTQSRSTPVQLTAGQPDSSSFTLLYMPTILNRSSPVQISSGTSFTSVSAGTYNSAAITSDNRLFVWGDNASFQLPYSYARKIVGNLQNSYFLKQTGELLVVGANSEGRLGLGDITARPSWTMLSAGTGKTWIDIDCNDDINSTGFFFAVGIKSDGGIYSWGTNANGELGLGDTFNRSSPTQIGTSSWTSVAVGAFFVIAIRADSTLWSWGQNTAQGQLGLNDTVNRSSPVQIGTSSYTHVWTGTNNAFARDINGNYYQWGFNSDGNAGMNNTIPRSVPTQITSIANPADPSSISVARRNIAYINNLGQLFAWGANSTGELGDTTTVSRSSPVQIMAGTSFTQVAVGGAGNLMAISTTGALWIAGNNSNGQIGDNSTVNRSSPVQLNAGTSYVQVFAGFFNLYHLPLTFTATNIRFTGAGANAQNQLGDATLFARSNPISIMASDSTGGNLGQVAQFNQQAIPTPTQIPGSWTQVSLQKINGSVDYNNTAATLAIRTDGTLWGWGLNNFGQLGLNITTARISITQIGALANYTNVSTNVSMASLLNSAGQAFVAGANTTGNLGQGDTIARSSPTQVNTGQFILDPVQIPGSWSLISASDNDTTGSDFAMATRTDSTLYVWGKNNIGQLGTNDTVSRSSPTQIGVTNGVGFVSTSFNGSNYYLAPQIGNNLHFGDSDFTYECWVYLPSAIGLSGVISKRNNTTTGFQGVNLDVSTTAGQGMRILSTINGSTFLNSTAGGNITANVWTHVAVVRIGGFISGYINGTVVAAVVQTVGSNAIFESTDALAIGARAADGGSPLPAGCVVTNVRIVRGVGIYTGNFTPSSTPLQTSQASGTNINAVSTSQTILLTLNSSLISDNSSYTNSIIPVGTTSITTLTPFSSPTITSQSFIAISAGVSSAAAIDSLNRLFTWGWNNAGQLGQNDTTNRSSPTQVGVAENYRKVVMGTGMHVTAFGDPINPNIDNLLFGTGLNTSGALGDSSITNRSSLTLLQAVGLLNSSFTYSDYNVMNTSSPVQISSLSYTAISAGLSHVVGQTSSGLYVWGLNNFGQLGDNSTLNRDSPIVLTTRSNSLVSAGIRNTFFTMMDPVTGPRIMATGQNPAGNLGDNTIVNRSNAVQVSFATIFNTSSPVQTGTGNYTGYYLTSPIQIGTVSWSSVSVGDNFNLAITSSGLLFAWGYNAFGQVGDNTTINRSSPVQLSSLNSWTQVSAGTSHSIVKNSNDNAYTFGSNSNGQLGDNT